MKHPTAIDEEYIFAKSLLSDKFDTKEFHTVILDCGTTSFDVLEKIY